MGGGLEQQGWDVLTFGIRGRFSHHLTIHPPSLLLTGHPSVPLLPALCLWGALTGLGTKETDISSRGLDSSTSRSMSHQIQMIGADFPGQDGQRPVGCDQASAMQHKCSTIDDHLIWCLIFTDKILKCYSFCFRLILYIIYVVKCCQFVQCFSLWREELQSFRSQWQNTFLPPVVCKKATLGQSFQGS